MNTVFPHLIDYYMNTKYMLYYWNNLHIVTENIPM